MLHFVRILRRAALLTLSVAACWPAGHASANGASASVSARANARVSAPASAPTPARAPAPARAAAPEPSMALVPLVPGYGPDKPDPDLLLISIYRDLANSRLAEAKLKADRLVEAYPTFRLGQMIRGDILLMHARPVTGFGAASKAGNDKLNDLRNEAIVRIKSLRNRPDPGLIPRSLLQLRDDQKYALVIDTRAARLYVYQHFNGHIKFVTDYYISHGKFGINKLREGDQRTPIGVYYITSRLSDAKLPEFYGSGALPINYPNEWDKLNGRGGSGIWLHGTPPTSFSRAPLASDGCVVLANPDMEKLLNSIEPGKTPVILSDKVEFVNHTRWDSEREAALKLLESWRRDMESKDLTRLLANYSRAFKSQQNENLNTWFVKTRLPLAEWPDLAVKLREMTLFRYPGNDNMLVATFTQDNLSSKNKSTVRKRQYWQKEAGGWKIIFEATI